MGRAGRSTRSSLGRSRSYVGRESDHGPALTRTGFTAERKIITLLAVATSASETGRMNLLEEVTKQTVAARPAKRPIDPVLERILYARKNWLSF